MLHVSNTVKIRREEIKKYSTALLFVDSSLMMTIIIETYSIPWGQILL